MSVFRPDIFDGQVALLTGGGSGIGLGITMAYAKHGMTTVIVSRSLDKLQAAAERVTAETGQRCIPIAADVRDEDAVYAAVKQALEETGRIDHLVNGAAGNFLCPSAMLKPKGFRTVLEIDTLGTFISTRAVFDQWMRDNGGSILNISMTLHYLGTPMVAHAMAAKAGCDALVKNWAVEWGGLGIRVNAVAPGGIEGTEGMDRLLPPGMKEKFLAKIPLGRFGTVEDIGDAAVFLASDAARYVTGEILVVDGGDWLTGTPPMGM